MVQIPEQDVIDAHFVTLICYKNCCIVCLKRPKINEKETDRAGPFKIKYFDRNLGTNRFD